MTVQNTRRKRRWGVVGLIAAAATGLMTIAIAAIVPLSSDTARRKVIEVLAARLDAEVELASLQIRVVPGFRADGSGLLIRRRGRQDVPPMITVARFSARGSLLGLLRQHIARMEVSGLDIQIPPDHNRHDEGNRRAAETLRDRRGVRDGARTFIIDELLSSDAKFVMLPGEPQNRPKVWNIFRLRMNAVSVDGAMPFAATLTNAVPPGNIDTSGSFGPWVSGEPGRTPLGGVFVFDRADLGVFKGISGTLSAKGTFEGTLERIDVHGNTHTPDFTVSAGGHPMALDARYHAIVDGTNGNTLLEVDASFLHTSLVAKGSVVGRPGVDGRTVTLDVVMDRARLEDVLQMAVNASRPPMTGALKLRTAFELPPGDRDVVQKLRLAGAFTIADTRFSSPEVQAKIDELSRRTRGHTLAPQTKRVSSQFAGSFKLRDGELVIPVVVFNVPGAAVRMGGTYGLKSEQIAFVGTADTNAKISEMMTGFKSVLLKPADFVFKKDGGGSTIPIRIAGTRNQPSFGLDTGRVLKHP